MAVFHMLPDQLTACAQTALRPPETLNPSAAGRGKDVFPLTIKVEIVSRFTFSLCGLSPSDETDVHVLLIHPALKSQQLTIATWHLDGTAAQVNDVRDSQESHLLLRTKY